MSDPSDRIADRIERLRRHRGLPAKRGPIGRTLQREAASLERMRRREAGLGAIWERLCPPDLADRTRVLSLRRGTAAIRVADASTRFELDRWLRSGGLDALIDQAPATLCRVKLLLGRIDEGDERR